MITFLLILASLILLVLWILYYGFKTGMQNFSKPNEPEYSVYELKKFLGFDFGSEYTLLLHQSNPGHGDRPLTVTLQFTEQTFAEIMAFVTQLDFGETVTHDQKEEIKYWQAWQKNGKSYQKNYSATHVNGDYTFFRASLSIDPVNNTIHHHESGY